jgi:hypothetical protein
MDTERPVREKLIGGGIGGCGILMQPEILQHENHPGPAGVCKKETDGKTS